jgi:6-pyruvoyltetrahydropterin/6-carboxytetrahydropterin synthase
VYLIRKSVDIDFSHHIRGHLGHCINIHGHTWKFEVDVSAESLTKEGFVIDFKLLRREVLNPTHRLLDHAFALGEMTYKRIEQQLIEIGKTLLESRQEIHGSKADISAPQEFELHGARTSHTGGMKVTVFPFNPTSERLARWLFELAHERLTDERVTVLCGRVYETLHPVEAVAEYRP